MSNPVLYLGDTSLETAGSYLAGVLTACQLDFDYVDSSTVCSDARLQTDYAAVIISDYLSSSFTPAQFEQLVARTRAGMGLLMIGGWESFTGLGGDYHRTPLADLLPVAMQGTDDRVNSYSPCLIRPEQPHPITADLPFATHSAAINGYNRVQAKAGATTVLSVRRYQAALVEKDFEFSTESVDPLLVVDEADAGRVACYTGDVAPHWAGGFVDWGDTRHVLQAPGAGEVEIGNWYIQFFGNLVRWVAKQI